MVSDNAKKVRNCMSRGEHYLMERRDIGVRRFANTGEEYVIEQCPGCKCEFVRELPVRPLNKRR